MKDIRDSFFSMNIALQAGGGLSFFGANAFILDCSVS